MRGDTMNKEFYILVCNPLKTFTYLHQYQTKTHRFDGEHSLLHNRFEQKGIFLSKFLLFTQGHELVLLNHSDEAYASITQSYQRFLENDIEKVVEEQLYESKQFQIDNQLDKELGTLQTSIIKMMLERKLKDIQTESSEEGKNHTLLLGKELALEWALQTVEEIIKKGK